MSQLVEALGKNFQEFEEATKRFRDMEATTTKGGLRMRPAEDDHMCVTFRYDSRPSESSFGCIWVFPKIGVPPNHQF